MEEIAKTISALCQSLNTDFENIRVYQTKGIYIKKEGGWEKLESSHFDISPQSRKLIQQVWAILEKAKVSNIAVDHQLIKQQHKNPSDYQLTPQNLKVTFSISTIRS
jgi:hypothetical protein